MDFDVSIYPVKVIMYMQKIKNKVMKVSIEAISYHSGFIECTVDDNEL